MKLEYDTTSTELILSEFQGMARGIVLALLGTALLANPVTSPASSAKSTQKTKKRRRRVHAAPSYQLHPDPDRYRQIQQALADRGYFTGQANGEWKDDSVAALRHFQADQKLDGDGKIDALSLKALGLGAKHDGSTAGTVPLSAATSGRPAEGAPPEPDVPAVSELPSETAAPQNNSPQ
jgi:peptidoglycan hydrolase-like protein with peptidoglycan-binding domain